MACNCKKNQNPDQTKPSPIDNTWSYQAQREEKIKPTESCISCAQKHFAEAYCQLTEYGYIDINRTLAQGNLRQVVLHTFKDWPDISKLARECALLVQEVKDKEALDKMEILGSMIDNEFYTANPEARKRLEELKKEAEQ